MAKENVNYVTLFMFWVGIVTFHSFSANLIKNNPSVKMHFYYLTLQFLYRLKDVLIKKIYKFARLSLASFSLIKTFLKRIKSRTDQQQEGIPDID